MFDFLNKRPTKIVRVKFTRRVSAKGIDDTAASGRDIGSELDIDESELGLLDGSVVCLGPVTVDGTAVARKKKVRAAEYVREEVPARFADLPGCFTAFWKHAQEKRELQFKAAEAERALGATHGERGTVEEVEGVMTDAAKKFIAASDAVKSYNYEPIQRAYIECGNIAISEIRSVAGTRDALERTEFEIFQARAAALELNEGHARRLFTGSALYRKYVLPKETEHDMRSAGYGRVFMDAPLGLIAQRVFNARERRAELTVLLAKAKAELAAAVGATKHNAKQLVAA